MFLKLKSVFFDNSCMPNKNQNIFEDQRAPEDIPRRKYCKKSMSINVNDFVLKFFIKLLNPKKIKITNKVKKNIPPVIGDSMKKL